jgi:hypothetical protein
MLSDRQGNQINREGDKVYLTLIESKRKITLGEIIESEDAILIFKDPSKHLIRKFKGYGFNFMLLSKASTFNNVLLRLSTGEEYLIPREDILKKGNTFSFRSSGCETQVVMPLDLLEPYKQ